MLDIAKEKTDFDLEVVGSLDALAVEILRPCFDALVEENTDIVIDMGRSDFIDSSGIGAIVFLFKRLRSQGRTLTLTSVHGQPLELLKYLRVDKSIQVCE